MNKKNTKMLLKDFPDLYKQYYLSPTETCMSWGFATEDGWLDLIYELSQKVALADPQCEATQVKQKYGSLRFYTDGCNEDANKLIHEAEEKSYHICEVCGKTGIIRNDLPWIRTLCDKHYKEINSPEYLLKRRGLK